MRELRFRAWRLLLSLGAGLALALSFPEYNVPAIGWISLAGLLFAVLDAGIGEAALCGFVYGVAFYSLNIPWVGTVLWKYAPMPFWQAFGILTLLIIALSLFIASFTALVAWIAKRNTALALFAAPFIWVVLELWRARLPQIAFPWDMLGFVASHSLAVVQLASLTGIYGLSALVVAYDALLVWALRRLGCAAPWHGATAASLHAGALAAAVLGARLVPQAQPTSVAHLVQTNLPQYGEFPSNWNRFTCRGYGSDRRHRSSGAGREAAGAGRLVGGARAIFARGREVRRAAKTLRGCQGAIFFWASWIGSHRRGQERALQQRRASGPAGPRGISL